MLRLTFCILMMAGTALGEGSSNYARPVPSSPAGSFCHNYPCSPGCSQEVSCEDYDPRRDSCANSKHVLVGWSCSSPCSCASDGAVMCSVSYRCVDMAQEMEELKHFRKPEVELAQPGFPVRWLDPSNSSSAEESDSGEPIK